MSRAEMANKLFTLLHVSDLHIGRLTPDKNAPLPPAVLQFPALEGLLGHHRRALIDLELFHARERNRSPAMDVAVTGDLTASGSPDQFDLAESFLAQGGSPGFGFGLSVPSWLRQSVSGNHDQWGGFGHPFGQSDPRLRYHFAGAFPLLRKVTLPDKTIVEFVLVDSDSDVPRIGHERPLARGRFQHQLDHLEGLLDKSDLDRARDEPGTTRLRVLVLHHALSIDAGPAAAGPEPFPLKTWNPLRRLEIQLETMARLQRLMVRFQIRVALSGHVHTPRLSVFTARGDSGNVVEVLEARCGTTTQRDRYSRVQLQRIHQADQALGRPPRPQLPHNTLLLHELWRRDDRRLEWRCAVHTRVDGVGFVGPGDARATLPPGQMTRTLVI